MKPKDITWFIYRPLKWQEALGYRRHENYCSYRVVEKRLGLRQCSRKPKETIEGYGFCTAHARKVRDELGK